MMQLKNLHIKKTDVSIGNKNFWDTEIDFTDSSKYCTFIGLNASGKSNLLEIVSKIFASLYKFDDNSAKPDFGYLIRYTINDHEIEIELRKNPNEFTYYFKVDGEPKTKPIFKENITNYIPSKLISNYSGEESRLWEEVYRVFYDEYSSNIRQNTVVQNVMNYINKYNWDMALVSLLCFDDEYVKELLDISNLRYVNVKFEFDPDRYSNYGANPVIGFIDEINPNRYTSETIDIITLQLNNVLSQEQDLRKRYINLFNFLYVAYMPKDKKIITNIEVQFNDITTKQLSEGQKKLILVRFITHLLSDENSLLLFDEPDSHIHVSRKEKLAELISESPAYSLITTHSPALINFLDEQSVQLLKPNDIKGVEAIKIDKLKQIEEITESNMSIMDSTLVLSSKKNILMCEGVNDIKYIKKALEVLNRTQSDRYKELDELLMINCGGADNVPSVYEEIVHNNLHNSQICVCLFDYDEQGMINKKKIELLSHEKANVKALYHPTIDSGIDQNNNPDKNTIFLMENYFKVSSYKNKIINAFQSKDTFKSLSEFQNPKSIIQSNYNNFDDNDFENFHILFDKLLTEFGLEES